MATQMDDLEVLRASLRGRLDRCWDRLDDLVSELMELHEISSEEVIARVAGLAALERD